MRTPARVLLLVGFLAAAATTMTVVAQTKPADKPQAAGGSKHTMVLPDQISWGPGSPALPPGAQMAVLDGDPKGPGMFTLRIKFPDGYAVPPHWHPSDEHVLVLSGSLMVGLGDKADANAMHPLPAGGFAKMPRRTNHYVRAKGETVIQVYGMGPFELNYVNPKDDPRKKTTH